MNFVVSPHVLIEADRPLTRALWKCTNPKPIVWSPFVRESMLRNQRGAILRHISPLALIPLIKGSRNDVNLALENFLGIAEEARAHFDLHDKPLTVAVVGSHTGLFANDVGGQTGDLQNSSKEDSAWIKPDRSYIGQFYAQVMTLPNIEVRWLGECYPHLLPPRIEGSAYSSLASLARNQLGHGVNRQGLRQGALPFIFKRDHDGQWHPYTKQRVRTTTDAIIKEFKTLGVTNDQIQAVLTKVLSEETDRHNPMDNPFVTCNQLKLAEEAGLSAVLLDRSKGIIGCRNPRCPEHRIPVIGV